MVAVAAFLVTFNLIIPHTLKKDHFEAKYTRHWKDHLQLPHINSKREMDR